MSGKSLIDSERNPLSLDTSETEAVVVIEELPGVFTTGAIFSEGERGRPAESKRAEVSLTVASSVTTTTRHAMVSQPIISSTERPRVTAELIDAVESLFASYSSRDIDEADKQALALELDTLIRSYGEAAVTLLSDLLTSTGTASEVASEILKDIGRIQDLPTHLQRRRLLQNCLAASSRYVRDSAILGLSFMNDRAAIRHLEHALTQEPLQVIRQRLEGVITKLSKLR
jgi:hypothetical protein